jgi:molecular chaperone DnaK (HSP70)
VTFTVNDNQYTVEELVGLILKHAAENAQRFVGAYPSVAQLYIMIPRLFTFWFSTPCLFVTEQPISQFVITVPPFFNQAQRRALLSYVSISIILESFLAVVGLAVDRSYAVLAGSAAKFAGIKVAQLLNTNTAVAINFGIFRRQSFNETEQVNTHLVVMTSWSNLMHAKETMCQCS